MSEAVNAGKCLWIAQLDQEIDDRSEGTGEYALTMMLKDCLLSDDNSIGADTALQTDNFYDQGFLPLDALMRFGDDTGMAVYLVGFW